MTLNIQILRNLSMNLKVSHIPLTDLLDLGQGFVVRGVVADIGFGLATCCTHNSDLRLHT